MTDERTSDPITRIRFVTCVNRQDLDPLFDLLSARNHQIFIWDGARIFDKTSFFSTVADTHSAGKVISDWQEWHKLLAENLSGISVENIAIVWLHADSLLSGELQLLVDANDNFLKVAYQLIHKAHKDDFSWRHVRMYLLGDGPNFPMLKHL